MTFFDFNPYASPFLNVDKQINHLYERNYFPYDSITESDRHMLGEINFHRFLGYVQNFEILHNQRLIDAPKVPSQVFKIIDIDTQVSALLYKGIRNAEILLRHYTVKHYCEKYPASNYFLEPSNLLNLGSGYSNEIFTMGLANDIFRCREKCVVNIIKNNCIKLGKKVPKKSYTIDGSTMQKILEGVPLWSVVDSFSLGHLSEFVIRCDADSDPKEHIWRRVAEEIDFKPDRFQRGLDSLRSLRNLVSHHARIWMRPTTYSMPKKGLFRKEIANADPRSMIIAFYNLASFQGAKSRKEFAKELQTILDQDPTYKIGVSYLNKKR